MTISCLAVVAGLAAFVFYVGLSFSSLIFLSRRVESVEFNVSLIQDAVCPPETRNRREDLEPASINQFGEIGEGVRTSSDPGSSGDGPSNTCTETNGPAASARVT